MKKTISLATLAAMTLTVLGCNTNDLNKNESLANNQQSVNILNNKSENGTVIPGRFIIKYRNPALVTPSSNTVSILDKFEAKTVKHILNTETKMKVIQVNPITAKNAFNALKEDPNIEYIEPDRKIVLDSLDAQPFTPSLGINSEAVFPNDEMFKDQYAHKVSNSEKGWEITKGDKEMIIAIVDTGVDGSHPEFEGKLVQGYDVFNKDNPASAYRDPGGHGTHCAGIAAAGTNNKIGVAGFAPDVKIQSVRVLDDNGSGTFSGVVEGMLWAATHNAKIMSMSLGAVTTSKAVADAVQVALKNDVLVIAANGNHGNSKLATPASEEGVMAVAASDINDKRARFSAYGSHTSVTAPGVNILSTFPMQKSGMPGLKYGKISGTSMAAPAVSGLAALVRTKFPNLTALQVKEKIEKSADDLGETGFDDFYGHGRINVFKALSN